jgi:hypothetical protein
MTKIIVRVREGIPYAEVYPMRRPRSMYEAVLRADPCAYCGSEGGTLDHIVPRSFKGRDLVDNLTGACAPCNHTKSSQTLLEYIGGRAAAEGQVGATERRRGQMKLSSSNTSGVHHLVGAHRG